MPKVGDVDNENSKKLAEELESWSKDYSYKKGAIIDLLKKPEAFCPNAGSYLLTAVRRGEVEIVKLLLALPEVQRPEQKLEHWSQWKDENGNTALHYAVSNFYSYSDDSKQRLKLLLEAKPELTHKNNEGLTALEAAYKKDSKLFIFFLKSYGASIEMQGDPLIQFYSNIAVGNWSKIELPSQLKYDKNIVQALWPEEAPVTMDILEEKALPPKFIPFKLSQTPNRVEDDKAEPEDKDETASSRPRLYQVAWLAQQVLSGVMAFAATQISEFSKSKPAVEPKFLFSKIENGEVSCGVLHEYLKDLNNPPERKINKIKQIKEYVEAYCTEEELKILEASFLSQKNPFCELAELYVYICGQRKGLIPADDFRFDINIFSLIEIIKKIDSPDDVFYTMFLGLVDNFKDSRYQALIFNLVIGHSKAAVASRGTDTLLSLGFPAPVNSLAYVLKDKRLALFQLFINSEAANQLIVNSEKDKASWRELIDHVNGLPEGERKAWLDTIKNNAALSPPNKAFLLWKFIFASSTSNETRHYLYNNESKEINLTMDLLQTDRWQVDLYDAVRHQRLFCCWLADKVSSEEFREILIKAKHTHVFDVNSPADSYQKILTNQINKLEQINSEFKDINEIDRLGRSPLMTAISSVERNFDQLPLVEALLKNPEVKLELDDLFGENMVHYLARLAYQAATNSSLNSSIIALWKTSYEKGPIAIFVQKNKAGKTPLDLLTEVLKRSSWKPDSEITNIQKAVEFELACGKQSEEKLSEMLNSDLSKFIVLSQQVTFERSCSAIFQASLHAESQIALALRLLSNPHCSPERREFLWSKLESHQNAAQAMLASAHFKDNMHQDHHFAEFFLGKLNGNKQLFKQALQSLGKSYLQQPPSWVPEEKLAGLDPSWQDYAKRSPLMLMALNASKDEQPPNHLKNYWEEVLLTNIKSGKFNLEQVDVFGNNLAHYVAKYCKEGPVNDQLCLMLLRHSSPRLFSTENDHLQMPLSILKEGPLSEFLRLTTLDNSNYDGEGSWSSVRSIVKLLKLYKSNLDLLIKQLKESRLSDTDKAKFVLHMMAVGAPYSELSLSQCSMLFENFKDCFAKLKSSDLSPKMIRIFYLGFYYFGENAKVYFSGLSRELKTALYLHKDRDPNQVTWMGDMMGNGNYFSESWKELLGMKNPPQEIKKEIVEETDFLDRNLLMLAIKANNWLLAKNCLASEAIDLTKTDIAGRSVLHYMDKLWTDVASQSSPAFPILFSIVCKQPDLLKKANVHGQYFNRHKGKFYEVLFNFLLAPQYDEASLQAIARAFYLLPLAQQREYRQALTRLGYFDQIKQAGLEAKADDFSSDEKEADFTKKLLTQSKVNRDDYTMISRREEINHLGQTWPMRLAFLGKPSAILDLYTAKGKIVYKKVIQGKDNFNNNLLHYLMRELILLDKTKREEYKSVIRKLALMDSDCFIEMLGEKNNKQKSPLDMIKDKYQDKTDRDIHDFMLDLLNKLTQERASKKKHQLFSPVPQQLSPAVVKTMLALSQNAAASQPQERLYKISADVDMDYKDASDPSEVAMRNFIAEKNASFATELANKIASLNKKQDSLSQTKAYLLKELHKLVVQNPYYHPKHNLRLWVTNPGVIAQSKIISGNKEISVHPIEKIKEHRGLSFGRLFGIDTSSTHDLIKKYAITTTNLVLPIETGENNPAFIRNSGQQNHYRTPPDFDSNNHLNGGTASPSAPEDQNDGDEGQPPTTGPWPK